MNVHHHKAQKARKQAASKLAAKPGRPVADEKSDRRQLLLDMALELFARQGIAGTSLQQIAEHAQVTPALVHYYFGNKEQLIEVVLNERIMPIMQGFDAIASISTDNPLQTLLALTERMLNITTQLPWMPALWVREVLNEDGYLREWAQQNAARQLSDHVGKLVHDAQVQGTVNASLDPRLMVVSMVGLTLFPLTAAPMIKSLPGNEDISIELLRQHMLEVLQHGIVKKVTGSTREL